jgi:hypothetical protein
VDRKGTGERKEKKVQVDKEICLGRDKVFESSVVINFLIK